MESAKFSAWYMVGTLPSTLDTLVPSLLNQGKLRHREVKGTWSRQSRAWNPQILVFEAVCFHCPGTQRWGNLDLLRVHHEMSPRNWQVDPLWLFLGSCLPGETSEVNQGTPCTDPEPARRKRRTLIFTECPRNRCFTEVNSPNTRTFHGGNYWT